MKSARPKVLHEIAGPLDARPRARGGGGAGAATRRGRGRARPRRCRGGGDARFPGSEIFVQRERLGTAHAVLSARGACSIPVDDVVVAFADTPLVTRRDLRAPAGAARRGARPSSSSASRRADPTGYGRVIVTRRASCGDPRAPGRLRRGARDHPLQCRPDGAPGRRRAGASSKRSAIENAKANTTSPTSVEIATRRGPRRPRSSSRPRRRCRASTTARQLARAESGLSRTAPAPGRHGGRAPR